MSEELQQKLRDQLWEVANRLRGNMSASDFMYFTLGFIFYKYLSEKIETYANSALDLSLIHIFALRLVVRNQIARRQFVEVAFREVQKTAGLLEAQHVFGVKHLLFEFCNSHLNTFLHN